MKKTRSQISRENGARSRGPATPEGKRLASRNSLRHGLLSGTVVLAGESRQRFQNLLDCLTDEFQPETESQLNLVQSMAVARWRQLRIWGIEKATYDHEIEQQDPLITLRVMRSAAAFKSLADQGRQLDLIHRYETSYERQYQRALKQLHFSKRTQQKAA